MIVKCNKSNECTGRYLYSGKKYNECRHYGEHEKIMSGASQPTVACVKEDHCPNRIKGAYCLPVEKN